MANTPSARLTGFFLPGCQDKKSHVFFEHTRFLFAGHRLGSRSDCLRPVGRADGKVFSCSNVTVPAPLANVENAGASTSPVLAGSVEAGLVLEMLLSFTAC